MKVVLLNPPNKHRIQRRFMCSYNAPNQLLPPQELMALGGMLRDNQQYSTVLIDAIAEQLSLPQTLSKLSSVQPDVIVAIQGFECFDEDMEMLQQVKNNSPGCKLILFGHYATLFPQQILETTNTDIVILGEPDNIFISLMDALLHARPLAEVSGIAYKSSGQVIIQPGDTRIGHPEQLPMPAYEMLHPELYFEPFLKAPFGLIQTARGCPYNCNYCVRSFGKRLTYRTTEQIIDEIVFLKQKFGIRSLRFIDDTFTVHTNRVIEICKKMIDLDLQIEWTCLSRVDTLREEMIPWMKKAGCKRIYFGVESGSTKVLQYFDKPMDLDAALSILKKCTKAGIETLGLFIVGAPVEDQTDFDASVNFAIRADFDYIIASELAVYPGTPLYAQLEKEVDFSLFPYKNEWKDEALRTRNKLREKEFYRRFYYRPRFILKHALKAVRHPLEYLQNFTKLGSFVLGGRKSKRADYI
jgi:anaerobic magnesium-protoporphyrin IX monomethyl ester cyclase